MATVSYSTRDGKLRLYDATVTPSPYFIEIPFVNAGFSGPVGRPIAPQMIVLDRGRLSSVMHYQEQSDEAIITPVQISFTFKLLNSEPNLTKFYNAMNISQAAVWTVGANTWTTTKGRTQLFSGGAAPALVTTPTFLNSPRRRTVNVEVLYTDPTGGGGTTGFRWAEVEFEPDKQTINEGDTEVTINANGTVYGAIANITSFTSGTQS